MTLAVTVETEQEVLIDTEQEVLTGTEEESEILSGTSIMHKLVLWNDDFNTFEHVIACMIKFIKKTHDEAADIAFTVHTKGKCIIAEAPRHELIELYHILLLKKLTVSIE